MSDFHLLLQNTNNGSLEALPEDPDKNIYRRFKERLMQDIRLDAYIDIFIEKCHRGVGGDFGFSITGQVDYQRQRQPLSHDDAAFIAEMIELLITDLRDAGCLARHGQPGPLPNASNKVLYEGLRSRVGDRYNIWSTCWSESKKFASRDTSFLKAATRASSRSGFPTYEEWRSFKENRAPTLQQMTDQQSLQLLGSAVRGEQATATFACGGTVKIRPSYEVDPLKKQGQLSSPPIILRWDGLDKTVGRRIELPLPPGQSSELNMLLEDCQPATFGLGGEDVLDESYRKASKLDNTQFATNFNPYDYGIVDTISQVLFPSVDQSDSADLGFEVRGVRAELYKLNIYSGPSGMFHPHVDTPRGSRQFGSLVVCLPCVHSGGELLVRHGGTTVQYDWSTRSANSNHIQWAAFYSDCEHEVVEVTGGHRLTLTYNLYLHENLQGMLSRTLTMSPEQLPLYSMVRELLAQPGFMKDGGVLGFFCSHAYAHTYGEDRVRLSRSLKGVDMALYVVFRALGLKIDVLPIFENPENDRRANKSNFGGISAENVGWRWTVYPENGYDQDLDYDMDVKDDESDYVTRDPEATNLGDYKDVETRLQSILNSRKINGFMTTVDPVIVGTELHNAVIVDRGGDDHETQAEIRDDEWPNRKLPRVQWLNDPKHKDNALTHMAYGNQAKLTTYYSAAALLVIVPPGFQRGPFPTRRTPTPTSSEGEETASSA